MYLGESSILRGGRIVKSDICVERERGGIQMDVMLMYLI